MADVTVRLIWYRLGECVTNMADRFEKFQDWYEELSVRRVDILDMLFLAWLLVAFLVVGTINIYLKFFGRPKLRGGDGSTGFFGVAGGLGLGAGGVGGESCQWVNSLLSWLYLHYDTSPEFIDNWLRSLNEQTRKQTVGNLQVKIERIQPGSLPPKFTAITTEVATKDTLTVRANVEASDVTFLVSALHAGQPIQVSNCDVTIQKLFGQIKIHSEYHGDQIDITATFPRAPDVRLSVRFRNEPSSEARAVEQVIRNALCNSTASLSVPPRWASMGGGGYGAPGMGYGTSGINNVNSTSNTGTEIQADIVAPVSASQPVAASLGASLAARLETSPISTEPHAAPAEVQPKTMRKLPMGGRQASLKDRRLLVKVIKANGLGDKDYGCSDPYCVVQMDEPPQKHSTSIVKSTMNPFWDEHFLIDLDERSKTIKFEVFDREKPPGDDFLGRSQIPVAELRRMPSSRQIIPLSGRPGATGTITVEFLFMEAAESHMDVDSMSPRRRIDTNRVVTPGGTLVTTTTTTTEKQRDSRLDSFNADSPARIEKTSAGVTQSQPYSGRTSEYSPYSSRSSATMEPGMTASQVRESVSRGAQRPMNLGSPNITVTQHSPYSSSNQLAGVMGEPPSPTDGMGTLERRSHSTGTAPDQKVGGEEEIKKSKSFGAAIRKRFNRPKKAQRSQSADRAGYLAMRDDALLKPSDNPNKTTDIIDEYGNMQSYGQQYDDLEHSDIPGQQANLRKSRSHSFSNSLKKIFRKKKKDYPSSRESSISRASTRATDDIPAHSPNMSSGYTSAYHNDNTYPGRDGALMLSTSVPVHHNSPLYDH